MYWARTPFATGHVQRRIHNKLEAGHPQSSRASARNGHLKTADYRASSLSTAGDWNSKPKVFHRVFDFDLTRNRNAPHPSHSVLDSGELARYLVCCDYDQIKSLHNQTTTPPHAYHSHPRDRMHHKHAWHPRVTKTHQRGRLSDTWLRSHMERSPN